MEPRELLVVLGTALLTAALDLESPEVFPGGSGSGFGVSVAGVGGGDRSWLLVGAPHAGSGSGAVFSCTFGSGTCRKLPLTGPPGVNQSRLGLAMAAGDDAALVCGPIAPQVCGVNVHLNGFCVQLDTELRPVRSFPETIPECPKTALDIAILMDGSGSIADHDFRTMKTFIAEVMRRFRDVDAQFSLTQFSHAVKHHFDFSDFRKVPDPARLLRTVRQLNGATYTATAIQRVLQEMFVSGRGARAGARRVLVVVTDGEKFDDPLDYSEVIPLAEAMAVTRYAIGVGSAFGRPQAHLELQVIASGPTHGCPSHLWVPPPHLWVPPSPVGAPHPWVPSPGQVGSAFGRPQAHLELQVIALNPTHGCPSHLWVPPSPVGAPHPWVPSPGQVGSAFGRPQAHLELQVIASGPTHGCPSPVGAPPHLWVPPTHGCPHLGRWAAPLGARRRTWSCR
nr:integrin alpha-M-like [Taeniopygia guttata]